ncbi:MAG: CapA family protein, partial [Myxococcales bacterium]|nr:CapA family protein [Myxococcales bacterium]
MARGARAVWLLTGVLLGALALAPHGARGGERGPALIFAGDVMLDRVTKDAVFRRSLEIGRDRAYAEVFADARAVVGAADVAFANLETPISSRLEPPPGPGEPPRFNAPIELLESLGHAGFDVLSIANNHAYDQGMEGLDRTLSAARRVGLPVVGAGPDAGRAPGPVVFETAGGRIAFAAWTQGVNRRFGSHRRWVPRVALAHDDSFESTLAAAREAAPLVVASLHWARRKSDGLGDAERALLRRVAEAGADVIVGHGLHVPGPIERLRTRDGRTVVAIHTLGNWLGAMRVSKGALQTPELGVRDAPLVSVRTRASGDGRLEPAEVSVIPFWIASPRRPLPWWPGRQRAGARPLSIRGELERIARADCGRRCARRAQAYRKRMELQRVAMGAGME